MYKTLTVKTLDIGGSLAAMLCVAHCLVLQAVLILAPWVLAKSWLTELHLWLLLPALTITGYALLRGCRIHRRLFVPLMGGAGLVLMATALTLHNMNWEMLLTLSGSSLVLAAHYHNWKNHTRCEKC